MPYEQADLVASMIEEADFTAALAESLHQVARRVKREPFGAEARTLVDAALGKLDGSLRTIMPTMGVPDPQMPAGHTAEAASVEELRMRLLNHGPKISTAERGAILALLGSVERAELLVQRIDAERKSVNRANVLARVRLQGEGKRRPIVTGGAAPALAE
jgi:phosphate:Na+ symporter